MAAPKPKGKHPGKRKSTRSKPAKVATGKLAGKILAIANQKIGNALVKKGVTKQVHGSKFSANAKKLAYSILNPTGAPAYRFPSTFGCDETALLKVHNAVQLPFPTYAGTYSSIGVTASCGLMYAAIFRDPLRSLIYLSPGEPRYSYTAKFAYPTGLLDSYSVPAVIGFHDVNPIYFVNNTTYGAPHGPVLFCGHGENPRNVYVWWDLGATITLGQYPAATGDSVLIEAYGDGSDATAIEVKFTTGVLQTKTLAATDFNNLGARGVYVRFVYANTAAVANALAITIGTTTATDVFCHRPANGVHNHLQQLTNARVNAACLLMKNTAPAQYKDGFVSAANLVGTVPWNSLLGLNSFMAYANGKHYKEHGWDQGVYGCLLPGDTEDSDFFGYCHTDPASNNVILRLSYPLVRSRYSMFVVRCAPQAYAANLETHIFHTVQMELQSTDPWLHVAPSGMTIQDGLEAYDLLRHAPLFYENPSHLEKIGRFVQGAGSFFRAHASKIGAALAALFPQFAPAIGPLALLAQS